jgi:hypothetical protein
LSLPTGTDSDHDSDWTTDTSDSGGGGLGLFITGNSDSESDEEVIAGLSDEEEEGAASMIGASARVAAGYRQHWPEMSTSLLLYGCACFLHDSAGSVCVSLALPLKRVWHHFF